MKRLVLFGLCAVFACRDRGHDTKRVPQGSAGSGSAAAQVPEAPAAMPASYARLVGDRPATPGSALASLHLGEVIDPEKVPEVPATSFGLSGEAEPRIVRRPAPGAEPRVLVDLEMRADKLFALRIELLTEKGSVPEDHCAGFARALEAKWGPAPERVWTDATAHVRAALRDTCILSFERYTDVASWIGPEPTSIVPVFAVGKKPTELSRRVGSWTNLRENLTYRDVGVGEHASGPTVLDVYLNKGKVVGLSAETAAAAADRAAIRERISSAFGAKPTHDATTGYDVWATKVPIRMLDTPSGVRVEVGRLTL